MTKYNSIDDSFYFGVIYRFKNIKNGKLYFGKTRHFRNRMRSHRHDAKIFSKHLYNSINKYGWESFEIDIIDVGLYEEHLSYLEEKYIKEFNTTNINFGYNERTGGEGGEHSQRTKDLIGAKARARVALPGYVNPFKGKVQPKERIEDMKIKVSASLKAHYAKETTVHPRGMLGKKHSEERRKGMSENKKKICLITYTDGSTEIIQGVGDFLKRIGSKLPTDYFQKKLKKGGGPILGVVSCVPIKKL